MVRIKAEIVAFDDTNDSIYLFVIFNSAEWSQD